MIDLEIALDDRPGALAEMARHLRAGVSIEGGGVFVTNGAGVAHFLFADGQAAPRSRAAASASFANREVVMLRLHQGIPGQLGIVARRMADAGVNIRVQYSDHDHQLVLVVDPLERAKAVAEEWMRARDLVAR
jgi:hypothetical protein